LCVDPGVVARFHSLAERAGCVRLILSLTPRLRSGPTFACPNSLRANLSNRRVLTRPLFRYFQLQRQPGSRR
jgi:hypothetical protein